MRMDSGRHNNPVIDTMKKKKKRIIIVGAGMSGLCTCKHLLQAGLDPLLIEASDGVGGVWRNTYKSTVLQNSTRTFQFSDHPWPEGTPIYPSHYQVLDYFQSYATRFHLLDHILFNCKLLALIRRDHCWQANLLLCTNDIASSAITLSVLFDYVILCVGRFGDVPRMPSLANNYKMGGPQVFRGQLLHAMDYSTLSQKQATKLVEGQRVAIVGFHKSALDIALEAAQANYLHHQITITGAQLENVACTLIYRRPYWFIADDQVWGFNLAYLFFSRFSQFVYGRPGQQGLMRTLLNPILSPLRWAITKLVEVHLARRLPLRQHGLVPEQSFVEQMSSCVIAKPPQQFFNFVEDGRIRLCHSPNWRLYEDGIILDDGNKVEADVIILATGYDSKAKLLSIIPSQYKHQLLSEESDLLLYRGLITPQIPQMAILGYQENFATIHSSEMGARWLAHLLTDRIHLPNQSIIESEAKDWASYIKRSSFPNHSCLGLVQIWYADQLCKDIGWSPRRKKSWFHELFSPYTNLDYCD